MTGGPRPWWASPWLSVLLALLWPGLGQAYNGRTGLALLVGLTTPFVGLPWLVAIPFAYREASDVALPLSRRLLFAGVYWLASAVIFILGLIALGVH